MPLILSEAGHSSNFSKVFAFLFFYTVYKESLLVLLYLCIDMNIYINSTLLMPCTSFTFHNFNSLDPSWCVVGSQIKGTEQRDPGWKLMHLGIQPTANVAFHFNKENKHFIFLPVYGMTASHLKQIKLIPTSSFHKNIFERDQSKKCNNLIGNRQKYE